MQESEKINPDIFGDIVSSLGIDNLSKDKQTSLLLKMTEILLRRIFLETMDKLGEKGRDDYEAYIQKNPQPQDLEVFFAERIKNYDALVNETISDFKKEMTEVK